MEYVMTSKTTNEKLIASVSTALSESNKWITSRNYSTVDPITYKTKQLPIDKKSNIDYAASLFYVHRIAECVEFWKTDILDEQVSKEILKWNEEGMLCAYTSVLLWCLLYENEVFNEDEMRLVQGYHKHKTQGMLGALGLFGNEPDDRTGVHAWVEVSGSVIDLSIVQEQGTFDFPAETAIIEEIPFGMELTGWQEGKEIVMAYAHQIALEQNMKYDEWIDYHKWQSRIMAMEIILKES